MNKRFFSIVMPILLIAAGAAGMFVLRTSRHDPGLLKSGETYLVWLTEAEVADRPAPNRSWDMDGSGPDLFATISFHESRVFRTETARDTFTARWEPTGLNFKDLLAGEVSTSTIRKVAHVTVADHDTLEIAVFDQDPLDSELVEGVKVSVDDLRQGENVLRNIGNLKRLVIAVNPVDEQGALKFKNRRQEIAAAQVQRVQPRTSVDATVDELDKTAGKTERTVRDRTESAKQWLKELFN
jgi:hypothetical protein